MLNGEIQTEFIDIQEYASALAHIMLRNTPPQTIPNITGDLLK